MHTTVNRQLHRQKKIISFFFVLRRECQTTKNYEGKIANPLNKIEEE